VRVTTPFSIQKLREFCRDLERFYRINPLLEFAQWRSICPNHYALQAKNLSNGQQIATEMLLNETDNGFKITYTSGLKTAILIQIETETFVRYNLLAFPIVDFKALITDN
jgi:hypothetical protein